MNKKVYLICPDGEIKRFELPSEKVRDMLKNGYVKATVSERIEFLKKEKEKVLKHVASANLLDVFFVSPQTGVNDGYGTSHKLLKRECEKHGVFLNPYYDNQKVGIVYNYPYSLESLQTEHKVLFTMFESTKMPSDWGKYLDMADEIIVPSKFCQNVMKRQFGVDSTVINLGYDQETYKFIEREKKDVFNFLHYDAFKWRKGWDIVLTAFDEEFGDDEPVKLTLKSVKEKAPNLDEYKNVEKISKSLENDEMMELLKNSDCMVFPSRGEGFGLTPLECMATGMPVIVPNAHGISEYFNWEIMPELQTIPIKAKYSNSRFVGMDLGEMFQCTVKSVRKAMRNEYKEWILHKNSTQRNVVEVFNHAKNFTIFRTGKELSSFLKNSYKKASEDRSKKIVYLSENIGHFTGGRYYSWFCATALQSAGYDVEIYTNKIPLFIDEFKDYPQPTVFLVDDVAKVDVKAQAYFGSPVVGNKRAIQLGEKYGKKAYCEIFDPFPMMEKYRGKHNYPEWNELIPMLKRDNVHIISLCNETNKYIYPWLNKKKYQVHTVYPCINSIERDKSEVTEKENWAVFVSRLDNHKKLDHVLEAVKATDLELHIVTSIDGINFDKMLDEHDMRDRVKIHWSVSDKEKFEIIKKSKVMINGAIFEGFGMWLAEALACGVPCVCYDYCTFREIKKDDDNMVFFAKWNDPESLKYKLKSALRMIDDNCYREQTNIKRFDFPEMTKTFKSIMEREPKIGVVTICLNEEEFISQSINSIVKHPNIAKIAVVEGLVDQNEHTKNKNGLSVDKTEVIMAFCSYGENGKVIYDRYGYAGNKSELRNRALDLLGKDMDYILVVDGDEVWKHEDIDKLVDHVKKNSKTSVIWFDFFHFWKKPSFIAVGGQWKERLFRFFKYEDKTLHWELHETPPVNSKGIYVSDLGDNAILNDIKCYHYGYMKDPERVKEKLEYYKKRDTDLDVKDTFSEWKDGDDTQPTHGGGGVEEFKGTHPDLIIKKFDL